MPAAVAVCAIPAATNYVVIVLLVLLMSVLSSPITLLLIVGLGVMWSSVMSRESITIGSTTLTGRSKFIALSTVTGVLTFIFAGSLIFSVLGLSSSIVAVHAVMNDRGGLDASAEEEGIVNQLALSVV